MKIPPIFTYKCLNLHDSHTQALFPILPEIVESIDAVVVAGGKCLVHCQAGISRSAALVLAYLVNKSKMSLDDAFDHLRERRPVASPNLHFWSELQRYEHMLRRARGEPEDLVDQALHQPREILVDVEFGKPKRD